MSSVAVKENQAACAGRKNSSSEDTCDLFSWEPPTGRPSILRQSQADNISRTAQKGAKVCFQTPRRDPVTKRIMSPNRTSGTASKEESAKALETYTSLPDQSSVLNTSSIPVNMQSNSTSYPDDDMPVQSRGTYMLDLNNLDDVNPFQGSNKMANSPPKSSDLPVILTSELTESGPATASVCAPVDTQIVLELTDSPLDETLPFVPSVENSLADNSADISSAEGTVIIKTDNIEKSIMDTEDSDIAEPAQASQQVPVMEDQPQAQDSPLPPAGSYKLDFDNLESLNPFQTGGSKIPNSPMVGKAAGVSDPPLPNQEAKQEPEISVQTPPTVPDVPSPSKEKTASTEVSSSTTPPKENPVLLEFNFDDGAEVKCKPPPKRLGVKKPAGAKPVPKKTDAVVTEKKEPAPKQLSPKNSEETEPVDVPPAKGSYTFDFDKFDDPNFNPFGTNVKMDNSPPRGIQTSPVLMQAAVPVEQEVSVQSHPTVPDVPSVSKKSVITEGSSSTTPPKENPVLLEFNFDDGAEVKCKPPPKRLGVKKPAGAKPVPKKTDAVVTEKKEPAPKQLSPKNSEETEPVDVLPAKSSYTFDVDKFDDPNFNPFGTNVKMDNSPPRGIQTSPVLKQVAVPLGQPEHRSPQAASENLDKVAETELSVTMQPGGNVETSAASRTNIPQNSTTQEPEVTATPEFGQDLQNQTLELGVATPGEDEFVPGALFMPGGDFDGQMDYLEQFGSNTFKESALRKQSLYLKFDPLLKESPKKMAMESCGFSLPRPSLAIRMMEAAKSEGKQKSQCNSTKLLDDLPLPVVDPVVPDPTVLDLLVPTLRQPVKTEDSIIEVLKYSQRDMDAALQKADRQAEDRQQQLNAEIETLRLENQQMLFVVSEFEATITQITEEHKQKEDLVKIEMERVLQEKEQLAKDLNDLERSFSSVVKRLDRCKEVIEGFKKNEETLKQYAQNCMDRIQKEEKRYQTLKTHAEEKLDQANKAISDVRAKMGTEVATLQVQLKREQLKVQSLEKDLEQKTKEVKDVTELCDELLLKVQKHGF